MIRGQSDPSFGVARPDRDIVAAARDGCAEHNAAVLCGDIANDYVMRTDIDLIARQGRRAVARGDGVEQHRAMDRRSGNGLAGAAGRNVHPLIVGTARCGRRGRDTAIVGGQRDVALGRRDRVGADTGGRRRRTLVGLQ